MMLVSFKSEAKRSRWIPLSTAPAWRIDAHMIGWMLVFWNGNWRNDEGREVSTELVEALRARQVKVDAPRILDTCEESGVVVLLEGDSLRVRGPITNEIRDDLKRCKAGIIGLLSQAPAWDESEARDLERRLHEGHNAVRPHLHPTEDDVFSIAARNVLADVLCSVRRAIATRRLDYLRRRVDFALGWMATLDSRLHELRVPQNRPALFNLQDYEGVGFTKRRSE